MSATLASARAFVSNADLPAPRALLGDDASTIDVAFDTATQQAAVVGSDVVSFVTEITPEQRSDIVNSTLLAQLVAKKKHPLPADITGVIAWYDTYFDVLSNIGFVIQDQGFAEYTENADTFEAHEAILEVARVALAGAPGALALVIKTLESLKKMDADSPWITLFNRESRSANTARFQVTIAEQDAKEGLIIRLLAFGLQANAKITQVLFFRLKHNEATLHHHSGKISINPAVLAGVRDDVARKISAFTKDFVAGLDL